MDFKKIQLNGFKSFADKTNFLIEDGLTGIVGPNGCGKSNIVESLRWCMGENSAKSMRGSGMEDVIFSGTSNRASKNISEVTLLLDNNEKKCPVQYKEFEEISVKRKIEKFLSQPFHVAEVFTGTPGVFVNLQDTINGFDDLVNGKYDDIPEAAFYMVGTIEEAIEKSKNYCHTAHL